MRPRPTQLLGEPERQLFFRLPGSRDRAVVENRNSRTRAPAVFQVAGVARPSGRREQKFKNPSASRFSGCRRRETERSSRTEIQEPERQLFFRLRASRDRAVVENRNSRTRAPAVFQSARSARANDRRNENATAASRLHLLERAAFGLPDGA